MGRRALIGTIATLGAVAVVGLFAALSLLFSSPDLAYAQGTNSAPEFTEDASPTREVNENSPAFDDIGTPVTATDADNDPDITDRLTYSIKNARTSPFTIVRSTGQLQVGQPLDYEAKSSYKVVVQVTDSKDAEGTFENPPTIDDTITVTINVNNVEEAGKVSLTWTRPQVGAAITADLTDPDVVDGAVTWQWAKSSNKSSWDDISSATSPTYAPQSGDGYLRATASYNDGKSSDKTAQAVTITKVIADPDPTDANPPVITVDTRGGYGCDRDGFDETAHICLWIPRKSPAGDDLYYPAHVTDPDHREWRYTLEGTNADLFTIHPTRGTLYTTEAHIYDNPTNGKFEITITVTDPSDGSDSIDVVLKPSGGGRPPVVNGPSRITYPENGTWALATYSATAANEGSGSRPIEGWIIAVQPGGGDGDFFDIDDDGNLTFTQPPDYENPADDNGDNRYSFSLHVYDTNPPNGGRPAQTFFSVTVIVEDVTVEALEINGPSAVRYAENGKEPVATYTLSTEQGATAAVDEWVLSGADGDEFSIDDNGVLTFNSPPDYENPTDVAEEGTYRITLTAYAGTDSKTEFVFIRVEDVNEPPEFDEGGTATREVEADAEVTDLVGEPVNATDPDGDGLTYSLPDDATLPFSISQYTGQLSVDDTIDQNRASYPVAVIVTDNDPDNSEDDRIIVTVNVAGGGNNAPAFPDAAVTFNIAENPTRVVDVGSSVTADDDDNDTLSYSLGGTDAGFFTIVDDTGQIQTKANQNYDFETKPTYSVTVTANDGNGGTATKDVTISLTNVDEDGTVNLSTNQPTARVVITATVTDPDKGVTNVTWQWAKSSDGNDPWTNVGTNSSYMPADADFGAYLRATASYTDDQASGKTAQAQTTQTVQTGTNRPADFSLASTTREVAENAAAGQPVGAPVTATDADNDDLTYSLGGGDASLFDFETGTGQIKVKSGTTLDYEGLRKSYTVSVEVTDGKNADGTANTAIDDSITVTINVTDVDEDGTVALSMTHPSARTPITATLTDPDAGVTGESWQWAKSTDGITNWTDVGTDSSSYTPPDEDVGSYLRATVSYEDTHGQSQTAEAVTDNAVGTGTNRAPTFDTAPVTLTVAENSAANVNVGSPVTATDLDTDNTLEYSLDATGATLFDIDSTSGQIKTKLGVTYDFETKPSYSVTVKADDGNTGTATKAVTITLNNLDEDGTVSLSMTHPSARTQLTATLTDPDGGVANESWQWAKANAQDGTYTDITDAIAATYTPEDGEVGKWLKAKVSYDDDEDTGKTAEAVTDNAVGTGTNRAPTFASGTVTLTVPENSAANVNVGSPVTATDGDNDTLTYSLEGTDKDSFTVVPGTGQIQTKSGVTYDFETKPSYSVTVKADDGNGGTATKDVTITLNNLDEAGTVTLSTNAPSARAQVTATLTDPDGNISGTSWQWAKSSDGNAPWTDVGTNSASYTPLDADVDHFLRATASYTDGEGGSKTAEAETTQKVGNGTNRVPEFGGPLTTTREVAENTASSGNVGAAVAATDLDNGDTLTYSLAGADASSFTVDGTGQIKVGASSTLDFESTKKSYTVIVQVHDGKNASGSTDTTIDDTIVVTINVTDVNEPPLKPGTPTVSRVSNSVVSVTWTAPDNTGRPPILYYQYQYKKTSEQLGSGEPFSTSGPTTSDTISTLDAGTSYDVQVWAVNAEGPGPWSDTGTGSTNSPPEFSSATAEREVAENTVVVTSIGAPVTATDANSDALSYTLEGADANSFQIVPTSGQIETKSGETYDHEAKPSYTVKVKADDSNGGTDTIDVTITVTDVNEAPDFDGPTTTRDVPENTPANTDIGDPVEAEDPDTGVTLTYSLGGTDVNSFDIDTSTGQLKTKAALDHETKSSYTVTVSVRDSKDDNGDADIVMDDTIDVTITVTDVNDPPEFGLNTNARSIAENTVADTNIGAPVRATDADNDNLTYTLEGTDDGSFAIDESSGQLKTKSALDHETKDSYTVMVKASDGNGGVDTIEVTITVTDVNEAPSFDSLTATRTVPENTAANLPVGAAVAAKDQDDGDSLAYSLGGTDSASFGINGSTGQITVGTGTTLNYETRAVYEVTVTATDLLNLSDTITVTINVTEGNDTPVFATDTATRRVAENTPASTNLGDAFSATDADNDNLTYTLEGTDAASFDIVSTSGQLQTKAALDYEDKPSYSVTVKAADASANGTITVTITVTDVNEPPLAPGQPDVSGDSASSVSVAWTSPANTDRPAIAGYDYQYKKTNEQSWSGATYATDGVVTSATISGLDASTSYDVQVRAKNDEGTGPWSATGAGSTGNTDPAFSSSATTRDVAENTPADVNIGDPVAATDDDSGDSLTYTLGGVDAAAFDIDSKTGQLKTKALLDRETKGTYMLTVTATDSANASDIVAVFITVTNVNEPPYFGGGADNRKVAENTPPGGPVGLLVSAEDDDAGDTLTYSMGGADSASFGIDNGTGLITVGTGTRLDFEDGAKTTYEVTVTATDSSYVSATITVTIEVLNVDEKGVVTLSQLQPQVDTALRASLDDPDGRVSGLTWEWEISSDGSNGWAAITGGTTASYTPVSGDVGKFLRVTASYSDGEGINKTAQAAATNAVRDVPATNDAPEFPSSENGTRTVAENTGAGENVGAPVTATDADTDTLTYKLSGVDARSFFIVADSGQIQTKSPLDHEAKTTYTVTVTATDPSGESDDVTVNITVTDVDEPPLAPGIPAMTQNTQTSLTMAWTTPGSTGRPAVTDYDYQYKKTAENTWTEVTNTPITDTSVEITGLEATTYYDVQVQATNDEGTGDWSDSGIGVTRTLPNTPPEFPGSTTERHVTENTEDRQNVGNPVDARDTDNDDLTYILEGTDADSFMIDGESGQLKTKMPLDHEAKSDYSVLVKAEDGRGGSDTIGVTIKVTNVNEPPKFSGNLGVHSVLENTTPGVDIGAPVKATDPENDPLTYSLDSAGAQVFAIDASTGQLQTKAVLDYETARVHSVIVYVRDGKDAQGATDSAVDDDISVTITVTNVNEPPAFTEAAPSRSVAENSVIDTDVGPAITAADPEGDTLTYSLDGTDKASFSIDTSSGQLKTGTALDFESGKRRYSVTVSVSDGKNADGKADTTTDARTTVTIAVADVDEPPAVTIRSTVRYAENGDGPVDTYTATDPEDRTITWDISGTDVDDFRIRKVNNEGVLEFRTPPNFEAPADADGNNVYLVTVEVSDGTNTDRLDVAVTVYGVNEEPAFPAETGSRSVDENTAAGVNIGNVVAATDPEGDTLIYKLAGTDTASFAIDTSTGQLKTKAPLDFETKDRYEVTVQVRDSLDQDDRVNAVTDDTIDITININNVEEAGWIVMSSRQPQVGTGYEATVIDPDGITTSATNPIWKWERSAQQSSGWTPITGETSASYTPATPADDNKYFRVTATYTDGEGSGKTAVKVSDNAVRGTPASNDPPDFGSTTATRAVDEGTLAGQTIGTPVSATDPDNGDANLLTYFLEGTDKASFTINRATGQLLTKAPLDYETKASYRVTVKVVDPSLLSDSIDVTINVNDVDEPPVLSGPDVVDYPENGTDAVAQYTAEDPEERTIDDWSLEGDDEDLFEISDAGVLTFKSPPDHDVAGDKDGNNIYKVTVAASDGTNSVTLAVEVIVSNLNEAPVFPDTEDGQRTVAENTAADQDIGAPVAATDPDSGDTLTYTLGGADAASFAIDEDTGQLKTKAGLDYEDEDTYTVTVTATDQSGLSDEIDVTITVTSVNEPPEFPTSETGQRSVAENTVAVQNIGDPVAATDPETDTIAYTLGGDDAASFTINEATGQLKTWDPLDYEFKPSYSVTVSVSDGKDIDGNADTVIDNTIDVTITVTDQDEDGTVILSSLQPQVDTALTATLVEPDDATNVSWTWHSSSNWSSGWTAISGATSDSYTPVTGDVGNYLRATATFTNSANAQVSVHGISAYPVRAAPANNAAPAFATATATRSVAEDAPVGSAVGDPVTATDTDADVLTYALSGTDAESFTIGMASGQLRTNVALDHDTKASYSVVVKAADPSGLSDTITVTITVTDENEPPVISGKTSVYYAEGRTDAVATYTATDPEGVTIDDWSLDGDDKDLFEISTAGVLTFKSSPDHDVPGDKDGDNVYLVTVQASDGTNTVSLDVTVTVRDAADPPPAPDAPTVTAAATDGHTALSVSWQAPAVTGASPITDYEVEYGKQGTEDWSSDNVTITGVTAAITNVLPDTDYEVRVRAENADGWGKWSEPGTGRTEVTPLDQQIDLTVSYHAAGYTVDEGATRAVSVRLSAAADRALQVPITVAPTTAQPGDYQVTGLTSGALSFVPGDSSKSFTFEALDDTDTSDETVTLGFGQPLPDKVTAGDRTTSVVTIDDDDPVSTPKHRRPRGGGGGGGGSGGGYYSSSSGANKAPVFTEGDSASRSVAENTAAGVNIGKPVRATDADNDTLRYTVGGDDGSAFAVDSTTGQLRTKSALDFERKSSYRVTMGVFDPKGGSDTITVTITVTDVTDVPLASGSTQMIGVVDSEQDTIVSTLDGSVAVTFPSGSRSGDYQARLDYGLNNCNPDFSSEELWFCLTVDIFDNEGNLEQGVVLSRPATIKIRRNGDERGGVDAVLGLHAQGGVSVYTRGQTGGEWTELEFTLESDGVGGIVITVTGVSSFGLYAGTTDSSVPVQVSHQVATVPVPTQNTGGQGSSPEPTPTPTPTPQPGSSSEQSTTPEPTSTPEPVITPGTNPTPEPTLGHQVSAPFGSLGGPAATPPPTPAGIAKGLGNLASVPPLDGDSVPTAEPEVKEASFDSEDGESGGMPSWYIAIIMLGVAASIAGGGTYYLKRQRSLPAPITVRRSREFSKWWSG